MIATRIRWAVALFVACVFHFGGFGRDGSIGAYEAFAQTDPAMPEKLVPPRVVAEAKAVYPEGGTGDATVEIEIVIDDKGAARELKLVTGSPPFTAPALAAAALYRFAPALREGVPIAARFRVRIDFKAPATQTPPVPPAPPPKPEPPKPEPSTTPAVPPPTEQNAKPEEPLPPAPPLAPLEVSVAGEKELPKREPNKTTIDRKSIERLPGAFGDAFRAIEILPGVVPFASGLPYFFVRGALPSSAGFYLDSVRIPFLFHVGAGPSVINPSLVGKLDFYPGGYPASQGRFIGGIVSATTVPPPTELHADAEIRIFDAGAHIEAPFADGRGDAFVAGRYSYTAAALKLAAPTLRLAYWDYQAGGGFYVTPRDRLSFFTFGSRDHLGRVDPADSPEQDLFGAEFHRIQFRYNHARPSGEGPTARLAFTLGLDRSVVVDQGVVKNPQIGLRSDVTVPITQEVTLRGGTDLSADNYVFDAEPSTTADPADFHNQILASFSSRARGNFGSYVDLVIRPIRQIEIIPGIRVEAYGENGSGVLAVDPRASARVLLGSRVTSVTTFGVAHQWPSVAIPIPGLEPALLKDGIQSVVSESQGFEVALPESILAVVTVFHQGYDNLTDLLATCGPEVETCLLSARAGGSAYGLEVQVSRPLSKDIGGILSYTLSRAERTANGHTFVSDFDRTHVLHFALGWAFAPNWHVGARLTAYSGRPHSLLVFDDPTQLDTPTLVGARNALRRAWFYRVDARIERRFRVGKTGYVSILLEGMNVTLSKETIDLDCRVTGTGSGSTNAPVKCGGQEIGPIAIPSLGVAGGF